MTLLEAVAAEVGLSLRLGRLLTENRDRLVQQTALLRAAQALSGSLELNTVLERLVAGGRGALGRGCLRLLPLRPAARRACAASRCRASTHDARRLRVPRDARARGGGDPRRASGYGEPLRRARRGGAERCIRWFHRRSRRADAVERRGAGRARCRASQQPPVHERDAEVLEAFAGLASLALRNAETFTRSSRQARVQRGFYRIASVLGQSLSRAATLDAIAQAAADALGGAAAAVLMPTGRRLALAGSYQLSDRFAAVLRDGIERGDGPLVRAAEQGRVLAAPTFTDDERLPEVWRGAAGSGGYQALLAVPVESPRDEGGGMVAVLFAEERVVLRRGSRACAAPRGCDARRPRALASSSKPSGARVRSRSS